MAKARDAIRLWSRPVTRWVTKSRHLSGIRARYFKRARRDGQYFDMCVRRAVHFLKTLSRDLACFQGSAKLTHLVSLSPKLSGKRASLWHVT